MVVEVLANALKPSEDHPLPVERQVSRAPYHRSLQHRGSTRTRCKVGTRARQAELPHLLAKTDKHPVFCEDIRPTFIYRIDFGSPPNSVINKKENK